MEWLEKEDLRRIHWCNIFKACVEDCQQCLWNTLNEETNPDDYQFWDIDNDIAYNFDNQKDDDEEFNY